MPPIIPQTPPAKHVNAPPFPIKAITFSRKADECKPLTLGAMEPRVTREEGTRALIMVPTRELAVQVIETCAVLGKCYHWAGAYTRPLLISTEAHSVG